MDSASMKDDGERLSVDEYRRRAERGEFSARGDVELLEGLLVPQARRSLKHDAAIEKIQEMVGKLVPNGWHFQVQQAIRTADSQPEPDIAIVRDALDGYADRAPEPEDIALVIEV